MTANAFELPPSASSSMPAQAALYGNRFIQALVATLLLGGLLALSVDLLLLYISLPDATGDSPGWLQRYDAAYFLTLAANGLSDLWIIALSAWLMVGYLFERNGQIGYRRPRPLLLSLLLISLGLTLVINVLLRLFWAYGFEMIGEMRLGFEATSVLVRLTSAVTGALQWAVSAPLAIWLSLHLFRKNALAGPLRAVGRFEAASLAALCSAIGTLILLALVVPQFDMLSDLKAFASYYGIGIAVILAAFVGARQALPARLHGLRPLDLLAASLVNAASVALCIGSVLLVSMLNTYGEPPSATALLVLGVLGLPLCSLMQAFCIRVIYRPVAA